MIIPNDSNTVYESSDEVGKPAVDSRESAVVTPTDELEQAGFKDVNGHATPIDRSLNEGEMKKRSSSIVERNSLIYDFDDEKPKLSD